MSETPKDDKHEIIIDSAATGIHTIMPGGYFVELRSKRPPLKAYFSNYADAQQYAIMKIQELNLDQESIGMKNPKEKS